MTRDEQIESLATQLFVQFHLDGWDAKIALDAAQEFYAELDYRLAARQPAPETPTPRIGPMQLPERIAKTKQLLALALELGQAEPIGFDQIVVCVPSTWNERETIYRPFVCAYAATLKERKEKADGA